MNANNRYQEMSGIMINESFNDPKINRRFIHVYPERNLRFLHVYPPKADIPLADIPLADIPLLADGIQTIENNQRRQHLIIKTWQFKEDL